MKKLDSKSALVGLVAGVLITFTLGADAAGDKPQIGRFAVAGAGDYAIILDTATGRAWTEHTINIRQAKAFREPKPQ